MKAIFSTLSSIGSIDLKNSYKATRSDLLILENEPHGNGNNWEKSAANNHYSLESKAPLRAMLRDLQEGDLSLLDLEKFAVFAAYSDLLRTKHHDETHNWKLLYDLHCLTRQGL